MNGFGVSICMKKLHQYCHRSVGMLLKLHALKLLNNIERIHMSMQALFNGNPCIIIISCYGPTNASDKIDIITFYNKLLSLVGNIPKHNVLIISGDTTAHIGKDRKKKNSAYTTH